MPLFEYRCSQCGYLFEHLVRRSSDRPGACPKCGSGKVEKELSTFSAHQAPEAGLPSCASGRCSTSSCATGACPFSGGG